MGGRGDVMSCGREAGWTEARTCAKTESKRVSEAGL